jgi:hypothetical protein
VDAEQSCRRLSAHRFGDDRPPVSPLCDVVVVAQAPHQLVPGARDPIRVPADQRRPCRESVAGQRGHDEMEGVLGRSAVRRRVGQRLDHLQQLDDRPGPAVGHDQRQGILVGGADVDEVDIDPVDPGHELRQGVQLGLGPAPVVVGPPVANELLHLRQLGALRPVGDGLLVGPARRSQAPAEVGQLLLGDADVEGADGGVLGCCAWLSGPRAGLGHCRFLSSCRGQAMGTRRSSGPCGSTAVSTQCTPARQVWFAEAGVRIRQWPARMASRGPAAPD